MMQPGPAPTLGELRHATPWVWLWCERCQHHAPLACAVAVIRWGSGRVERPAAATRRFSHRLPHPFWAEGTYNPAWCRCRVPWLAAPASRSALDLTILTRRM